MPTYGRNIPLSFQITPADPTGTATALPLTTPTSTLSPSAPSTTAAPKFSSLFFSLIWKNQKEKLTVLTHVQLYYTIVKLLSISTTINTVRVLYCGIICVCMSVAFAF